MPPSSCTAITVRESASTTHGRKPAPFRARTTCSTITRPLYAVKRPGVEPSYSREQRSIQALFGEQFLDEVLDQSTDRDLYLRSHQPGLDGTVTVVRMPGLRSRPPSLSRLTDADLETGLE